MIETLLSELPDGWYLYTLRHEPGHPQPWTTTLRHPSPPRISFAAGRSAFESLSLAADAIPDAPAYDPAPIAFTIAPKLNLRAALNLPTAEPIKRRI